MRLDLLAPVLAQLRRQTDLRPAARLDARLDRRTWLSLSAALAATAVPAAVRAAPLRGGEGGGAAPPAGSGAQGEGGIPSTLAPDATARFRAVASRLVEAMTAYQVPGAVLGILADGREEYAAFGYADVERRVLATSDTIFETGSVTKTYTGTAAMRLADEGRLDLEAPIRRYLPELRLADESVAQRATVRNLLTHTGGWWGDYLTDTGEGEDALAVYVRTVMPELPQIAPLGDYFSYNNAAFILLGRVLEAVTGRSYRGAMADLVLNPLDLPRSTFDPAAVRRQPHANGYALGREGVVPVSPLFLPRSVDPAGGLWSTTRELLRYARFHMGDGTAASGRRLLQPDRLRLMQTPQIGIAGQAALKMGMPWFVIEAPNLRLLYHGGDTLGQHAEFWIAPDAGVAFAALLNAQPGGAIAGPQVFVEVLRQYLGIGGGGGAGLGGGSQEGQREALPLSPEELAAYSGRYAVPTGVFTLGVEGDELVLTVEPTPLPGQIQADVQPELPPQLRARIVAPDLAVLTVEEVSLPIPFVRRPDGSVGWLSVGTRLIPRVADG